MATRRWSSNAIWMRSGWLRGSIYWVLLFAVSKPLSQIHRSTLLPLQDTDPTPSFGGFGLRNCGTRRCQLANKCSRNTNYRGSWSRTIKRLLHPFWFTISVPSATAIQQLSATPATLELLNNPEVQQFLAGPELSALVADSPVLHQLVTNLGISQQARNSRAPVASIIQNLSSDPAVIQFLTDPVVKQLLSDASALRLLADPRTTQLWALLQISNRTRTGP